MHSIWYIHIKTWQHDKTINIKSGFGSNHLPSLAYRATLIFVPYLEIRASSWFTCSTLIFVNSQKMHQSLYLEHNNPQTFIYTQNEVGRWGNRDIEKATTKSFCTNLPNLFFYFFHIFFRFFGPTTWSCVKTNACNHLPIVFSCAS